uniref:Uncharacterized protein n=1 Tax=Pararge aegeria TaxID=116150 RepID=S4P4C4_9NEOP
MISKSLFPNLHNINCWHNIVVRQNGSMFVYHLDLLKLCSHWLEDYGYHVNIIPSIEFYEKISSPPSTKLL